MTGIVYFGYVLVAASAALLASHWQQWRSLAVERRRGGVRAAFLTLQLQRRSVSSALIGVVGAAMTLIDRVPKDPTTFTAYVLALLLGGLVILMIGVSDMRATRRFRDVEHMNLLVQELKKIDGATASERHGE